MKQFELSTPKGHFVFLSEGEVSLKQITEELSISENSQPKEEGYKACVLECHDVLDNIGISSEKEVCSDPTCKSSLGHRLRKLKDQYNYNVSMVEELTDLTNKVVTAEQFYQRAIRLLSNNKEH